MEILWLSRWKLVIVTWEEAGKIAEGGRSSISDNLTNFRNELSTRPGTKQSWLSDRDPPAYGSILGDHERLRGQESVDGAGSVVNMYGLETDVIPPIPNQEAMQRFVVEIFYNSPCL